MLDRNRIHKNVEDILDECRQLEGANASERHRVDELLTHCCMYHGAAYYGPTYDAPTYHGPTYNGPTYHGPTCGGLLHDLLHDAHAPRSSLQTNAAADST